MSSRCRIPRDEQLHFWLLGASAGALTGGGFLVLGPYVAALALVPASLIAARRPVAFAGALTGAGAATSALLGRVIATCSAAAGCYYAPMTRDGFAVGVVLLFVGMVATAALASPSSGST